MPIAKSQLGNHIQSIIWEQRQRLFELGKSAQLAYRAFSDQISQIDKNESEEITIEYPLGLKADGSVIIGKDTYDKERLRKDYEHLSGYELSVTLVYNLVTHVEVLFFDLLSVILQAYPAKLGVKRQLPITVLFQTDDIDAARSVAISAFCNELAYKSPRDYAESVSEFFGFNVNDCLVQYPKYQELKATRDILIHNRGVANEVYVQKSGSHARAKPGQNLIINIAYFLAVYETCISMTESLADHFHDVWPSSDYETRKALESGSPKGPQMELGDDPFAPSS